MRFVRAIGILFTITATPAFGAGYQLKEHSADAMAAAYAGSAATGQDASYLAYNPAAASAVGSFDFSVNVTEILPGSNASYRLATTSAGNPTGGSHNPSGFVSDATVPSLALRYRLADRWAFGLSVTAPWGLRTDYSNTWAGRYYAPKTELLTINITPVISYEFAPGFAVAAGPQIEYAQGTLTSVIDTGTLGASNGIPGSMPGAQDSFAKLKGKDWNYGYTVGAVGHLNNAVTVGLSYHSAIEHDLRGGFNFTLDSSGIGATIQSLTGLFEDTRARAKVQIPDTASFGARDDFSDRWSGLLEVDWTDWSRVRNLTVAAVNPLQPPDVTNFRWHDTVFGSLGAEYRATTRWTFRGGVAYDESPVPDATREPRVPDSDRIWLSAGVSYAWNESTDLKLTGSHLFNLQSTIALDPAQAGNALRGTLAGSMKSDVNVVAAQVTFRN